jgi:hypothetical protein
MPPQRFFGLYGQLENIATTAGMGAKNDIAAIPYPQNLTPVDPS